MAVTRRTILLLAVGGTAHAQTGAVSNEEPLRALYGLAELQRRAATLAASRNTRPEVKTFAAEMATWREAQVPRLRDFLVARHIASPDLKDDQLTVWQALEPLDHLALSRRYSEVQVQALEIEVPAYEAASTSTDPAVRTLAEELLPTLRRMLDGARKVHDAVKP
jgi:putative membrane protein